MTCILNETHACWLWHDSNSAEFFQHLYIYIFFLKTKIIVFQILLSFRDSKLVANESYPEFGSCSRGEVGFILWNFELILFTSISTMTTNPLKSVLEHMQHRRKWCRLGKGNGKLLSKSFIPKLKNGPG